MRDVTWVALLTLITGLIITACMLGVGGVPGATIGLLTLLAFMMYLTLP